MPESMLLTPKGGLGLELTGRSLSSHRLGDIYGTYHPDIICNEIRVNVRQQSHETQDIQGACKAVISDTEI